MYTYYILYMRTLSNSILQLNGHIVILYGCMHLHGSYSTLSFIYLSILKMVNLSIVVLTNSTHTLQLTDMAQALGKFSLQQRGSRPAICEVCWDSTENIHICRL